MNSPAEQEQPADAAAGPAPDLPRRKSRSLRRRLAITLIAVSLVSVLLLGLFGYLSTQRLLASFVDDQLNNIAAARTQAIANRLELFKSGVAANARDESVSDALVALTAGYEDLKTQADPLDADQTTALETLYQDEVIDPISASGEEAPTLDQVMPVSASARYLQYQYLVQNPFPRDERSALDAAADGSTYSQAHGTFHRPLVDAADTLGVDDLFLIARNDEGTIVYSTDKRIDFATGVENGPYRDSLLARGLLEDLATVPAGEAIIVDFEEYLPAGGEPRMFAAAAVRDESQVVGALAVELPADPLNDVATAGGQWQSIGLGDTGETYVVGRDRLMRTDSRLWIEDPDAYLASLEDAKYPEEVGAEIVRNGSTVLAQPVDTEAVERALEGKQFVDVDRNYLDQKTLTVAAPLGVDDLGWVVVAGLAQQEADDALNSYLATILLVALILTPFVGVLGVVLARRITRPVVPIVDTAAEVASGDLDATVPNLGRNEYGDLANRLNVLTTNLRTHEEARAAEEQETMSLLLSALPPRLVERVRKGDRDLEDVVDTGTIIALAVGGIFDEKSADQEEALEFSSLLAGDIERLADRHGIERVRSSSDDHLFAAGRDIPGTAAETAAEFVQAIRVRFEEFARETGVLATYQAGLAAGTIATGIYAGNQLSFGVWGEPPRIALALNAVAAPGQILLHESVAEDLGPAWEIAPAEGLVDLRGEPVRASLLVGRDPSEVSVDAS